jgi:hypothetical protein
MTPTDTASTGSKTLAQRLNEGKLPVPDALRYSMILAEALRKIHDSGRAHGAFSPTSVAMTATGVELIPALAPAAVTTPYTAPELLQGRPADSRSDIFAFGAVVYEMLTGRKAFEGEGSTLTAALTGSAPAPSGSPAVDRLVAGCVAKDPLARWQRMQKVILELKLLSVAARRADAGSGPRPGVDTALRAEMQQLEARIAARFEAHEKTAAGFRETSATVDGLRDQVANMGASLSSAHDRTTQLEQSVGSATAALGGLSALDEIRAQLSKVASDLAGVQERASQAEQKAAAASDRVAQSEQNIENLKQHSNKLQENIGADLHEYEQKLKTQAAAIESARTAMAQTDDLVERVVEALELLQSSVLDHSEERTTASQAG